MGRSNYKYVKLSIPDTDRMVFQWLEAQENRSASIRYLIRNDVIEHGYTDPRARDIEVNVKPQITKTKQKKSSRKVVSDISDVSSLDDVVIETGKVKKSVSSSKKKTVKKPNVEKFDKKSIEQDDSDDVMARLSLGQPLDASNKEEKVEQKGQTENSSSKTASNDETDIMKLLSLN